LRPALAVLAVVATALAACSARQQTTAAWTGGDPGRGREALRRYGCSACHEIPGVRGATGLVGPPLGRMASRVYLAGMLPNTPDNLVRWIRKPQEVRQPTAMPDVGVTEQDGRDIAAYLYTLY
jgi:cytochrome c